MDDGIEVAWMTAAAGTAVGTTEIAADGSTAVGIPTGAMIELWIGAAGWTGVSVAIVGPDGEVFSTAGTVGVGTRLSNSGSANWTEESD